MSKYTIREYDIFMRDDPNDRDIGWVICKFDDHTTRCFIFSIFGKSYYIEWYPTDGVGERCNYYTWHNGEWVGCSDDRETVNKALSTYFRIKNTKLGNLL